MFAMAIALAVPVSAKAQAAAVASEAACQINFNTWLSDGPGIRTALTNIITNQQASNYPAAALVYQGQLRQNPYVASKPACLTVPIDGIIMQKAGVNANTPLPGTAAPAQPAAPANAGSVGPGEQIDNRLEAVEARDGVGNTAAAEAAARRAEAAADRAETAQRERNSAAQNYRRVLNRPGVTQAQISAAKEALRLADQKLGEARSSAKAAAADRVQTGLDRTATGADRTATAADRVQTGQDSAATAANRAWIQAKMWMLWVVAAVAALALLIGVWALLRSRKQAASATTLVEVKLPNVVTHEELDGKLAKFVTKDELGKAVDGVREELHERVNRVTDDVQLDAASAAAMKKAAVGDEVKATFTVNDRPTFGLKVTKISAKNFATVDEIGDTPAGQDIGDVIAFVRRAYKGRRNDLDAFKID